MVSKNWNKKIQVSAHADIDFWMPNLVSPLPCFGGNFPFMEESKRHETVSKMIIVCLPVGFDLRLGMFVATTLRSTPTTAFLMIPCFVMSSDWVFGIISFHWRPLNHVYEQPGSELLTDTQQKAEPSQNKRWTSCWAGFCCHLCPRLGLWDD